MRVRLFADRTLKCCADLVKPHEGIQTSYEHEAIGITTLTVAIREGLVFAMMGG